MKKMIRCFIVYLLLAPVVSPTIEVVFAEIKETAETSSISETKSSTTDQKEQPEQTTVDSTQPFSSQDNSKISEIPTSTSEKNQTISISQTRCQILNGGDEEIRTPDPLLARQVLSQLSYAPVMGSLKSR